MVFVQTPTILALSIMGLSVKGSDTSLIVGLSIGFVLLSVLAIWLTRKYYLSHTYEIEESRLVRVGFFFYLFIVDMKYP